LQKALVLLAEQDPLFDVRGGEVERELVVSLYGEVQRQVIAARLAEELGVEVEVLPTRVVHVERLAGTGAARRDTSDGDAHVALLLEPGPRIRRPLPARRRYPARLPAALAPHRHRRPSRSSCTTGSKGGKSSMRSSPRPRPIPRSAVSRRVPPAHGGGVPGSTGAAGHHPVRPA
jgi:hypothetical protein